MAGSRDTITIRRLRLGFPDDIDPMILEGAPEESATVVGMSLLLPYLEPYLIRTMQAAKPLLKDPALLRDLALFNGQEGQHYKQHIRFNEAIRFGKLANLKELETELSDDYRRFTAERSLAFNLAYAEGFEAFTLATSRFAFESRSFERAAPEVRALFEWHLVEEMEHRTVAFDVYSALVGRYFYRLVIGLFAQWHLLRFMIRAALRIVRADPPAFRKRYGGTAAMMKRLLRFSWRSTFGVMPKVLHTYMPWYSPHRVPMSAAALSLAAHYTELAALETKPSVA